MTSPEAKRLLYQWDKVIDLENELKNSKLFDLKGNKIPMENFPAVRALKGEKIRNERIVIKRSDKLQI